MKLTHGYNMARIVTEITVKLFWGVETSISRWCSSAKNDDSSIYGRGDKRWFKAKGNPLAE